MSVLVAFASRHGATAGIAERLATALRSAGLEAEAMSVTEVADITRYDAFVVGSAAYMNRWLKEAASFVTRHQATLATHPVWLFSSGPLRLMPAKVLDEMPAGDVRDWAAIDAWGVEIAAALRVPVASAG